jgi:hypothetical protein
MMKGKGEGGIFISQNKEAACYVRREQSDFFKAELGTTGVIKEEGLLLLETNGQNP